VVSLRVVFWHLSLAPMCNEVSSLHSVLRLITGNGEGFSRPKVCFHENSAKDIARGLAQERQRL